jgi:hypothetical protein
MSASTSTSSTPASRPGVPSTVPGGPTYREAQLCMEMIYDSGLMRSLDVMELNPAYDEGNRTAELAVELVQSLFGLQILARTAAAPTSTRYERQQRSHRRDRARQCAELFAAARRREPRRRRLGLGRRRAALSRLHQRVLVVESRPSAPAHRRRRSSSKRGG